MRVALSIGLPAMLGLMVPGSVQGATIYTYTGNLYTSCVAPFQSGGGCSGPYRVTVSFETSLMGAALANLPLTDITATLSSFAISDAAGPPPTDQLGFPADITTLFAPSVSIATDALGHVTAWNISRTYRTSYPVVPGQNPNDFYCGFAISTTSASGGVDQTTLIEDHNAGLCFSGVGAVRAAPGSWTDSLTPPTTVPEPGTCLLLGSALIGLARWRRQQR